MITGPFVHPYASPQLPRRQHQPHLVAWLYRDLVAHRGAIAPDRVGEKTQWCRAKDEIRRDRERRRRIARRVAEADALPASNRVDRHVRKSLILDTNGGARWRDRRGPRFRTAARGERESEHREYKVAPCGHRLLRNDLSPAIC